MLHEQLQQARRNALRPWLTGAALAALLAGAGAIAWLLPSAEAPAPVAETPAPPPPAVTAAPEPERPAENDATVAEIKAKREAFKQALAAFEDEVAPFAESDDLRRWNPQAADRIAASKTTALDAFALGDYEAASMALAAARAQAEDERAARANALKKAQAQAAAALDDDDADAARLHLDEVARIDPDNELLANMEGRLERLPHVLEALDRAAVARTENRPAEELRHLEQALKLEPERPGLGARIDTVRRAVAEAALADAVTEGMAAVTAGKLTAAQRALEEARAVDAGRREVKVLADRVAALGRRLALERHIALAERAAAGDNWAAALDGYRAAAKVRGEDDRAVRGMSLAERVLAADAAVSAHLQAPERLASADVSAAARQAVDDAQALGALSPMLAAKARRLSELRDAYSRDVPVRVVSDAQTHVLVRGVGHVGKEADKTISLKPGAYLFEGRRPGFKSKLVRVVVEPLARQVMVRVVCDEPV